jgi:hypothetical protein
MRCPTLAARRSRWLWVWLVSSTSGRVVGAGSNQDPVGRIGTDQVEVGSGGVGSAPTPTRTPTQPTQGPAPPPPPTPPQPREPGAPRPRGAGWQPQDQGSAARRSGREPLLPVKPGDPSGHKHRGAALVSGAKNCLVMTQKAYFVVSPWRPLLSPTVRASLVERLSRPGRVG